MYRKSFSPYLKTFVTRSGCFIFILELYSDFTIALYLEMKGNVQVRHKYLRKSHKQSEI
jgi:hypothetical protein